MDLAKEKFAKCNYLVAAEIFEQCLRDRSVSAIGLDIYFGFGDSLARIGRLTDAIDVYTHICNQLGTTIPLDKLKHLTLGLLESISQMSRRDQSISDGCSLLLGIASTCSTDNNAIASSSSSSNSSNIATSFTVDLLCCPACEDVLKSPVTMPCGHTYCKHCSSVRTQCRVCGAQMGITDAGCYENDVLIRRLVEKWWHPELAVAEAVTLAKDCMRRNQLDDALKNCNEGLKKAPMSYKGLLLRSDVLTRLQHYQSALADADNALKVRPTSAKAHIRRAQALAALNRTEEALVAYCLAVSFEKSPAALASYKSDVTKVLQRLLIPVMTRPSYNNTNNTINSNSTTVSPYGTNYNTCGSRNRRHRPQKQFTTMRSHHFTSDCEDGNSSCGEDDGFMMSPRRYLTSRTVARSVALPPQNLKMSALVERIRLEINKTRRLEPKTGTQLQVNPSQIELSDFDCVLCFRTLYKPVVTPCGHTYCTVCLDRCLDYSKSCPLCKSSLVDPSSPNSSHSSQSKRCTTRFLEVAMQRFIGHAYEKRQLQEIENEPSAPMFICTTAFPHVSCPLFVCEPRYRLMIRRAIESGNRQFGIAQPHTGRQQYADYGTMLDIRDCVLLGDGCSILSTVGCRRFRVIARDEKDGYDTAKVEYIHDEPISGDKWMSVGKFHDLVLQKAFDWFNHLSDEITEEIRKTFGAMPMLEENWKNSIDGPAWMWWIVAILPLNQTLKVDILSTTNVEKRLRAIDKTLDYMAATRKRKSTCLLTCEGMPSCQAIECCQRDGNASPLLIDRATANQSNGVLL